MENTENTTAQEVAADAQGVAAEAQQVAQREADKEETMSLDEARKLRNEAKNLRARNKETEDKLSKFEQNQLTEKEKLEKQLEETTTRAEARETKLRERLVKDAVAELKDKFGVRAPKSIARLIDSGKLEFDLDEGEVSGVEAELTRLRKDDPDLFIKGGTDGGKGGTGRPETGVDMNTLIRNRAGRG